MASALESACCRSDDEDDWHPNTGRYNLTRLLYSCLLSIPSFRYRIKIPKRDIPNTKDVGPYWPISKAALNAKCSERIQDLFELAPRPKHFAREHAEPKRHSGQGPFEGGHWAAPGALTTPMKVRITHLAVPRQSYTKNTKKYFGKMLTERQKKLLDVYIDNATKTVYYFPPKKRTDKPKKRSKAEGIGFKWPRPKPKEKKSQIDMKRLNDLATPKPVPPPPEIKRGKKVGVEEISESLSRLASPPSRYLEKPPDPNEAFKVKKGALEYNISDRIAEIAQPQPNLGPPPYDPYVISPAALHYEATPRIGELAAPRERKPPPDEFKEEPFKVKPEALKAMCTPRTAELAQPRTAPGK